MPAKQSDQLLTAAGWTIQDVSSVNIHTARGVAIRKFPLATGHGFADYLLYVDGKAVGIIEAKKVGSTLTGVPICTLYAIRCYNPLLAFPHLAA
jgi:type I restriction enzyme R subunit